MVELDIRRYSYAYALEHLYRTYVFQNQIMHQILYALPLLPENIIHKPWCRIQWQCYFSF